MGRRSSFNLARLLIAAIAPAALIIMWSCSSFDSPTSSSSSGGEEASASPDSDTTPLGDGAANDAPVGSNDAGVDAAPRLVMCGDEMCSLEKGEICCVFRDGGGGPLYGECVIGNKSACEPDLGHTLFGTSSCDEGTDCAKGQICCHTFNGSPGICGIGMKEGRCTTPNNCSPCGAEAGVGDSRIPCDEKNSAGQCPSNLRCGAPPFANSPNASSYCIP